MTFVDQNRKSPYVQQTSVDIQRQLPGNMVVAFGYVGARGDNLGYGGNININQLTTGTARARFGAGAAGAESVLRHSRGRARFRRSTTIARGQLLRPFPQFLNVLSNQSSGARSRYHALVLQFERRASTRRGRACQLHLEPAERQHARRVERSITAAPTQPSTTTISRPSTGRSLLDMPHRLVLAPIIDLPFGAGQRWANGRRGRLAGRRMDVLDDRDVRKRLPAEHHAGRQLELVQRLAASQSCRMPIR